MNILHTCPLHLSDIATLPWEIFFKKVCDSSTLWPTHDAFNVHNNNNFRFFTLPQKETNCNCCTAAWKVRFPELQWLHLTGEVNICVRCSYSRFNIPKIIKIGFLEHSVELPKLLHLVRLFTNLCGKISCLYRIVVNKKTLKIGNNRNVIQQI